MGWKAKMSELVNNRAYEKWASQQSWFLIGVWMLTGSAVLWANSDAHFLSPASVIYVLLGIVSPVVLGPITLGWRVLISMVSTPADLASLAKGPSIGVKLSIMIGDYTIIGLITWGGVELLLWMGHNIGVGG
jgi:hypothetical protein